ncbi:MAG: transcription repressor NadR [Lachnospiraceae bacterium]|nr:transcription repressor NadR [Lachnospiraceae bacterium]
MSAEERRNRIIGILGESKIPVSGAELSQQLSVSRQVIVQDMAIIRANGYDILATNRGYILQTEEKVQRVFKVRHGDDQIEKELVDVVDLGGRIKDVFVYHKVYGVIRADLNLKSRLDIQKYLAKIQAGTSTPLKNVTGGYHYHTIVAENEETLDLIQEKLKEDGFLASLQDYEPVNFWD